MAYGQFAEYYDILNRDADYGALFSAVKKELMACGITDGIVADLGCGTGELTLMLAKQGYDMIAVDLSTQMLSIAGEKARKQGESSILFLNQDLTQLDLFGTVRACVCTFDTLNHIGPYENFKRAISSAALFLEAGCPFIFDVNTTYKQEKILADNAFEFEEDGILCVWENEYDKDRRRTSIYLCAQKGEELLFEEEFYEYAYTAKEIEGACEQAGLQIVKIIDGETFSAVKDDSLRHLIVALKK